MLDSNKKLVYIYEELRLLHQGWQLLKKAWPDICYVDFISPWPVPTHHSGQVGFEPPPCLAKKNNVCLFCSVILALIRLIYQFANNVKNNNNNWVTKAAYNRGLFFTFLSEAAPKCRCFSLAQLISVVVGLPEEDTELRGWLMFSSCAVIGPVFCQSWGHYVTAKSTGRVQKFKPIGCCNTVTLRSAHPRRLSVVIVHR